MARTTGGTSKCNIHLLHSIHRSVARCIIYIKGIYKNVGHISRAKKFRRRLGDEWTKILQKKRRRTIWKCNNSRLDTFGQLEISTISWLLYGFVAQRYALGHVVWFLDISLCHRTFIDDDFARGTITFVIVIVLCRFPNRGRLYLRL